MMSASYEDSCSCCFFLIPFRPPLLQVMGTYITPASL